MKIAALAFASVLLGLVSAAHANPSEEQCLCDPKRNEVKDNGAWVKNASACWQSVSEGREWCDITVLSLIGDSRSRDVREKLSRAKADPETLSAYIQSLAAASISQGGETGPEVSQALKALPEVTKQFGEQTKACIDAFFSQERKKDFDDGGFSCHFGPTTGWLRMSYRISDFMFLLAMSPHE